jgi:hypothetical protein
MTEAETATGEERIYSPPLDKGIERAVRILNENGIETFESCEGGPGHAYPEPTVRFQGDRHWGFRAYAIACSYSLRVKALRRIWRVVDEELVGPCWEMIFRPNAAPPNENSTIHDNARTVRDQRVPRRHQPDSP